MAHLTDADLIRLRDGECDDAEERAFREHVAECEVCGERALRVERLVEGLKTAVEAIECPTEVSLTRRAGGRHTKGRSSTLALPGWITRRPLQVAAALALLATLFVASAQARAVVRTGWNTLAQVFSQEEHADTASSPVQASEELTEDSADVQPVSKRASFVPRLAEFSIILAHRQSTGSLSVTVEEGHRAAVQVLGDAESDELVVFDAGVRILNTETSSASYAFTLPSSVRSIVVSLGGQTIADLSVDQLVGRGTWRLGLAEAGTR